MISTILRRLNFAYSMATYPSNIEQEYVYQTYDIISEHFDHTRFARWPKVTSFINSLESGSIVYDVGCGNGKYLHHPHLFMLGIDRSQNLVLRSKEKNPYFNLVAGDGLSLPIRSMSCDATLSIAVLHHLSSVGLRLKMIEQMARILVPNGRGLLYVWCYQQQIKGSVKIPDELLPDIPEYKEDQDVFVNWQLQSKFANKDADILIKQERNNCFIVKRYYHLFKKDQLEGLVAKVKSLEIINSFYDKQNWCIEVRKKRTDILPIVN